jgi:hypothetical protein
MEVGNFIGAQNGNVRPTHTGTTNPTSAFGGKIVKIKTKGFQYWVGSAVDNRTTLVTIEVTKNG